MDLQCPTVLLAKRAKLIFHDTPNIDFIVEKAFGEQDL
jgi:hypothetical protein